MGRAGWRQTYCGRAGARRPAPPATHSVPGLALAPGAGLGRDGDFELLVLDEGLGLPGSAGEGPPPAR